MEVGSKALGGVISAGNVNLAKPADIRQVIG
jgi:hypothetical protein